MTQPFRVQDLQQDFNATPMTGAIGAEVGGDDIQLKHADEATFARIRALVSRCCVVVFRDQFLTVDELAVFGPGMGKISYTPGLVRNTDHDNVYRIDNPGKANAITERWHSDASFAKTPAAYTMLSAAVIPPTGGDTLFISQYASYDALSDGYKRMLRGLRARHQGVGQTHGRPENAEWPNRMQPLVRVHPLTGRRALFVTHPVLMAEIEGFTLEESKPILDFLYHHSVAIDRMYRHRWRVGDLVIWDNRCTLHSAAHDYGDHARTMFRMITEGEIPIEASDAPVEAPLG